MGKTEARPITRALYWFVAGTLISFGVLAILSIGVVFLVVGVLLALIGAFRLGMHELWAGLMGVGLLPLLIFIGDLASPGPIQPAATAQTYTLLAAIFGSIALAIAIGGIPYRCPPAPLEFAFLLEEWLGKRQLRQKTEIQYLYPINRVFTIESVAEMVTPLLDQRGIKYKVFFNTDAVDTEHQVINSLEGEEVPYDLLVMVPPHRGAKVIEASGLGDPQGWLPTHRDTLEVKGYERVFALGDATDLPVSKSGSAAHFEAKVIAQRLIAAVRGEEPDPKHAMYDGEVMCFLETGHNTATQLVFNYERPPHPPHPSRFYHMAKQLFNRAYWHIVPQGLV